MMGKKDMRMEQLEMENENLKNQIDILFKMVNSQNEASAKLQNQMYLLEEKHKILLERINNVDKRK